jgi:hypothetical protein
VQLISPILPPFLFRHLWWFIGRDRISSRLTEKKAANWRKSATYDVSIVNWSIEDLQMIVARHWQNRRIIVCRCSLSDSSLKQLRKTADELNERLAESFRIGVILREPYICTVGIPAWTIRVRVMWFNVLSLSPSHALSRYEPSSGLWSGFTRNRFAEADYGGQRSSVKLSDDW